MMYQFHDYLKHHYGEWKDGNFVGWRDMNVDAQRKKYYDDNWLTSSDRSKLKQAKKDKNSIILYTIVNSKLAKYLTEKAYERDIPCFGVLGELILNFSNY